MGRPTLSRSTFAEVVKRVEADLAQFKKSDANAINRIALRAVGEFWIAKYLMTRFTNKAYRLGYVLASETYKRKKAAMNKLHGLPNLPLIYRGELRESAAQARVASVTSTSTKGGIVRVSIPSEHPIHPIVTKVLRTIPAEEQDQLSKLYQDQVASMVMQGSPPDKRGQRRIPVQMRELGAAARRGAPVTQRA
jgi:hypothetical protein